MDALTRRGLWNGQGNITGLKYLSKRRRATHSGKVDIALIASSHSRNLVHEITTDERKREAALNIWRATHPIDGSPGETYFRNRGITGPIPVSLRYSPALYYYPINAYLPGIVAAVSAPNKNIIAIQQTFLTADGARKVPGTKPRLNEGSLKNGAVRLAKAETSLGIAEGIEDALSAMQLFDIPCWATLGAERFTSIWIPPEVIEVQVFADNDTTGRNAADRAAEFYTRLGKRVALRFPPPRFKDWNDVVSAVQREAA